MTMESPDPHAFLIDAMFMSAHMMFCLTAAFFFIPEKVKFRCVMGWAMLLWGSIDLLRCLPFFDCLSGPSMFNMLKISAMLMVPSFTMVMFALTYSRPVTWKRYACHQFPLVVLLVLSIIFASEYDLNLLFYHIAYLWTIAYGIVMLSFFVVQFRRYDERILNAYADIEGRGLRWLHYVLLAFGLLLGFWGFASRMNFAYARPLFLLGGGAITCYILLRIAKQKTAMVLAEEVEDPEEIVGEVLAESESMAEKEEEPAPAQMPLDRRFQFADELTRLMEIEQIWLDPDLNIQRLSRELATNRSYLSTYLNTILKKNFFDFVNDYRLQHATELLELHQEKTIDEVAQLCGFNNSYSFRRVFSKKYGLPPHEWSKQHRQSH